MVGMNGACTGWLRRYRPPPGRPIVLTSPLDSNFPGTRPGGPFPPFLSTSYFLPISFLFSPIPFPLPLSLVVSPFYPHCPFCLPFSFFPFFLIYSTVPFSFPFSPLSSAFPLPLFFPVQFSSFNFSLISFPFLFLVICCRILFSRFLFSSLSYLSYPALFPASNYFFLSLHLHPYFLNISLFHFSLSASLSFCPSPLLLPFTLLYFVLYIN